MAPCIAGAYVGVFPLVRSHCRPTGEIKFWYLPFFSFNSSTVLFFGIPFLGSLISMRTTISSPDTPEVKPRSFRPRLQPQRDTFDFNNCLRPILVTSHVGFAGSLAQMCAKTPKGGRSAALPTCSTSTDPSGLTSHSRAGVRVARCGSRVATPLPGNNFSFRAASILGLVCVLFIPLRVALKTP